MKFLVTGANGMLGSDVMREMERRGLEAKGTSLDDFSLTDFARARSFIEDYRPDVIIHLAAYTAVDKAEDEAALCEEVNAAATRNIAETAKDIGAAVLYTSTDYVFPGEGEAFYETTAPTGPQNAYGRAKLGGELAIEELLTKFFIVRIQWTFGRNGKNFVRTMLNLSESHDELTVVSDQIGSPTYTADLARLLVDMAQTAKYGVYHATSEGVCSWADFAAEIFRQAGKKTKVVPVPSSAYPTKAKRPHNSRLSKKSLDEAGFSRLPTWQDAVGRYLDELRQAGELA